MNISQAFFVSYLTGIITSKVACIFIQVSSLLVSILVVHLVP